MTRTLEKVTCFILCKNQDQEYLLLIEHPLAGFQLPAGTVETNETVQQACLREMEEETGITRAALSKIHQLGYLDEKLNPEQTYILRKPIFASEETVLRRGLPVSIEAGQVVHRIYDYAVTPAVIINQWQSAYCKDDTAAVLRRYFFQIETDLDTQAFWKRQADGLQWQLFWERMPIEKKLIGIQHSWYHYFLENRR